MDVLSRLLKADSDGEEPVVKPSSEDNKPQEKKDHGVTPGRPPTTKPLHPTRTPVQFSKKTGPKPKPHNSLLPAPSSPIRPLSPIKPINFSPKKTKPTAFLSDKLQESAKATDLIPEEVLMLDNNLNFDRWNSPNYWLRQDEIGTICDILNSINTGISGGTLVVPDTHRHPAKKLENVDWAVNDNPPITLDGQPACEADDLIGISWSLSRANDLRRCLVFHFHNNHWLLFQKGYHDSKQLLTCYDSYKNHGRRFDVRFLAFFSQFFNPKRGDQMPEITEAVKDYTAVGLDVQKDGSSCGFWAATSALLWVFDINPATSNSKKALRELGATGIKSLWKSIWTDWANDPVGLQASVLEPFLSKFSTWQGFPTDVDCIGPRPSRYNRSKPDQKNALEKPTLAAHSPDNNPSNNMADTNMADVLQPLFDLQYEAITSGRSELAINHERLSMRDLERLRIQGWVNDEIANVWREIILGKYLPAGETIGERPSFWVASTFFYVKLQAWNSTKDTRTKSLLFEQLSKFYRDIQIFDLDFIFLPIHLDQTHHWVLAIVSMTESKIYVFDSWGPTQIANQQVKKWTSATGADIIHILRAWLMAQAVSQQGKPLEWHEWKMIPAGRAELWFPSQTNSSDCGIFMLISMTHFVMFLSINGFDDENAIDTTSEERTSLRCDPSNVWNLRRYILDTILKECYIIEKPNLPQIDQTMSTLTSLPSGYSDEEIIPDSEEEK